MYYLSLSDLIKVDGFAEAFSLNDKEKIDDVLFENGMDVSKNIFENECNHRNLTGDVIYCLRYEGAERSDRSWKDTGAATLDAWIEGGHGMEDMKYELKMMATEATRDKAFI